MSQPVFEPLGMDLWRLMSERSKLEAHCIDRVELYDSSRLELVSQNISKIRERHVLGTVPADLGLLVQVIGLPVLGSMWFFEAGLGGFLPGFVGSKVCSRSFL